MDLPAAIKLTTIWLREEYENPQLSVIEAVLEIREELMGEESFDLGEAESDTAFQAVIDATRAELAAALTELTTNPNSGN